MTKSRVIKLHIKKDRLFPQHYIIIYIISRILFLIIMSMVNVLPYFTYDDLNIYSKVGISDYSSDYFLLRQIYINICCFLNNYLPGVIINGPRLLNIVVYYFSIKEVALLCETFDYEYDTIKKITLALILLPHLIIVSCSMVKDVLLIYLVIRSIRGVIYLLENRQQNYVWLAFVLVLLYFTRYGLVEILVIIFSINIILRSKHKFLWFILLVIVMSYVAYRVLTNKNYVYLMEQKLNQLSTDKSVESGLMNYLRINNLSQTYRLIFALPYMLTLGVPDLRQLNGSTILWMNVVGFFSFTTMFLIPAFYIYFIEILRKRQRNELITIGYFSIYHVITAINSPSLTRYMLCVYPIFIIFSIRKLAEHKTSLYLICGIFSLLYLVYLMRQILS